MLCELCGAGPLSIRVVAWPCAVVAGRVDDMHAEECAEPDVDAEPAPARN